MPLVHHSKLCGQCLSWVKTRASRMLACQLWPAADKPPHALYSAMCRFCCKSLFALVIKISFGCTHDFRVKLWGTSLREDKLAGDLGNVIGATSIRGRRSNFLQQEN